MDIFQWGMLAGVVLIVVLLCIILWLVVTTESIKGQYRHKALDIGRDFDAFRKRLKGLNSDFNNISREHKKAILDNASRALDVPIQQSVELLEKTVIRAIARETSTSFMEYQKEFQSDLTRKQKQFIKTFGFLDNEKYEEQNESLSMLAEDISILMESDISEFKVRRDIDKMMSWLQFQSFKLITHRTGRNFDKYLSTMSIEDIGFSERIRRALVAHGILDASQLLESNPYSVPGLGTKCQNEISNVIESLRKLPQTITEQEES